MANFQPAAQFSFSADGLTGTLTDISNYSTNTSGVTPQNIGQRQATISDGNGNQLFILTFPANSSTVNFEVSKDYYLSAALAFTLANSAIIFAIVNYLSTRIYDSRLLALVAKFACQCDEQLTRNMVKSDLCKSSAEMAFLFNKPSVAQKLIDIANVLINAN